MSMTPFGLCSWTLGVEDASQIMAITRQWGLDGLQFHGDHQTHDPAVVREAARHAGLTIFAIDPIKSGPRPGDIADAAHGVEYYLKLVDFAVMAGSDTVTIQGLGLWCQDETDRTGALDRLVKGLQTICDVASAKGIRVLWEMCNRYEVPMVRTCSEGRALSKRVDRANFGLILDSFHMNIEEKDALAEIRQTGSALGIYHVSDSGRGGIGSGHIDFRSQHRALRDMGFGAPVMLEFVLPGLGPNSPPQTDEDWTALGAEFSRSMAAWKEYDANDERGRGLR